MLIWLNVLASLFIFSGSNDTTEPEVDTEVSEVVDSQESGYLVIDSIEDDIVVVETEQGNVIVPIDLFPQNSVHEGTVIEWRIAYDESERRLKEAQSLIDRMQSMSQE